MQYVQRPSYAPINGSRPPPLLLPSFPECLTCSQSFSLLEKVMLAQERINELESNARLCSAVAPPTAGTNCNIQEGSQLLVVNNGAFLLVSPKRICYCNVSYQWCIAILLILPAGFLGEWWKVIIFKGRRAGSHKQFSSYLSASTLLTGEYPEPRGGGGGGGAGILLAISGLEILGGGGLAVEGCDFYQLVSFRVHSQC